MTDFPSIAAAPTYYPANGQDAAAGGGLLRPGAIDQTQFQQLLQAQYNQQRQPTSAGGQSQGMAQGMTLNDYRKLAGITPAATPVPATASVPITGPAPAASARSTVAGDGIPSLSLEQFAALTGMTLPPEALGETPATPVQPPVQSLGTTPDGQEMIAVQLATSPVETADAGTEPLPDMPEEIETEAPAQPEGLADGVPVDAPVEDDSATAAASKDSRVVLLDSMPDREEQKAIAARGQRWALKETPGARELFLGPDGTFGWDDFVDIINPLQHIPVVAQIYRAVSGDQAYGLSNFAGALPFGALSIASAVFDTVVRAQTGRDAGTDLAAAVFGIDNRTPEEADLRLASPDIQQMAGTGGAAMVGDATVQVADASSAATVPAAAWTRENAGIGRD